MSATVTFHSPNGQIASRARKRRPRVQFMTPAALTPHKEAIWAINAALVDWSREEFEAAFDTTPLYAVFFVEEEVVGLSAVMETEFEVGGRNIFTIGLGRAVVKHDYRNHFLVQRALIFRWARRFVRRPLQPIYIWGSCVSYKSYLSFVKVLKVVYPVTQVQTPAVHAQVIDAIGEYWYGEEYLPATKVVRVPNFKVRDQATIPTEKDLEDPAIRFYCDAVPNSPDDTYGLLTVSPCIRSNFLPMATAWMRNLVRKSLGMGKRKRSDPG